MFPKNENFYNFRSLSEESTVTGNIRNPQECLQENNLFYTLMPTRSRKEPRCLFLWNKLAATTQVEVGRNHAEADPQLLTQHQVCADLFHRMSR